MRMYAIIDQIEDKDKDKIQERNALKNSRIFPISYGVLFFQIFLSSFNAKYRNKNLRH